MAKKTILSKNQIKILQAISSDKSFCENFYLTGGTALAEFYLQHRLSEDLDFFSEKEFDSQAVFVFFKKNQKSLGIKKIDYQQLGSQFFKAQEVKDFPKMKIKENRKEWQKFFIDEARRMGNKVIN